jgi:Protein of unknown function (DUF1460)
MSLALKFIFYTAILSIVCACNGQSSKKEFKAMPANTSITSASPLQEKIGTTIIKNAIRYLGKPYVAHTLDKEIEEKLVIDTTGFDCYTLVETVLAQSNDPTNIAKQIQSTRYRNGVITDYTSRIHYFSEWIYENSKQRVIKDITSQFPCAKPYQVNVSFMSKNPNKYKQLKGNAAFVNVIKESEKKINQLPFSFIPKEDLASCQKDIKNGDIIAITTNIFGLDISHVGFAKWEKGILKLLHASTDYKKVVVSSNSLVNYLISKKSQTGVIILRPIKKGE